MFPWAMLIVILSSIESFSHEFARYAMRESRSSFTLSADKSAIEQEVPIQHKIAGSILQTALSIKPLYNKIKNGARQGMISRAAKIGVDWNQQVNYLKRNINDLTEIYDKTVSKSLKYPSYYLRPFSCLR